MSIVNNMNRWKSEQLLLKWRSVIILQYAADLFYHSPGPKGYSLSVISALFEHWSCMQAFHWLHKWIRQGLWLTSLVVNSIMPTWGWTVTDELDLCSKRVEISRKSQILVGLVEGWLQRSKSLMHAEGYFDVPWLLSLSIAEPLCYSWVFHKQ